MSVWQCVELVLLIPHFDGIGVSLCSSLDTDTTFTPDSTLYSSVTHSAIASSHTLVCMAVLATC